MMVAGAFRATTPRPFDRSTGARSSELRAAMAESTAQRRKEAAADGSAERPACERARCVFSSHGRAAQHTGAAGALWDCDLPPLRDTARTTKLVPSFIRANVPVRPSHLPALRAVRSFPGRV